MSLLQYLTPPALKANIMAVLDAAHWQGWTDVMLAHVLFRDVETPRSRIAVWRWRTGKGLCSEPWRIAGWVGVSESDMLYGDLTGKVPAIPTAPEVIGIRAYKVRLPKRPVVEVEEEEVIEVAAPPVAESMAEWIVPGR